MKKGYVFSFFLFLVLCLVAPTLARGKAAPTTPGKYTAWNGEVDELEIIEPFKLADYERIMAEPFDTSSTPLPKAEDNTYASVKNVLAQPTPSFLEGFRGELSQPPISLEEGGESKGKTLLIRGKVLEMDPGSKAARYWAGFGAGAARTQIAGEVVDAATGKVLLRFTQARRSGVGMMGGDYEKLMHRNLRQIGEDIAGVLKAF